MNRQVESEASPRTARDLGGLALAFIPVAVLTWGIHEFAHWFTGIVLGYDMWISFNQVGLVEGTYDAVSHEIAVALAGPVVTYVQAIVALICIYRWGELWTYALLYLAFWMRAMAFGLSFIANPNDEANVSQLLGLPMWVVPGIAVAFLLVMTILGSRKLKVGLLGNGVAYLMASIVTAIIVFSDQWLF